MLGLQLSTVPRLPGPVLATPVTIDASTRGRRNRANGAAYERKLATYLKRWWPDAVRAVRNTHPDPGDIAGTDPTLWWSAKDCQDEQYNAWFAEMQRKAGGRMAILVVRRRGHADIARHWAWISLVDLGGLLGVATRRLDEAVNGQYVRMELHALVALFATNGLTPGE